MTLTVTAWNVLQGGGDRAVRIVDALDALNTDVAVITEWRASSPNGLAGLLTGAGYEHQLGTPCPDGGYASILIASKQPIIQTDARYDDAGDQHRFVEFTVGDSGWTIAGAFVPGSERENDRKDRMWSYLVNEWAPSAANRNTLLCGDLNTGLHYRDELGATFTCSEHLAALESAGWRDAWIDRHRGQRPPGTWLSPRYNSPFRLDHGLLSPHAPRAKSAEYPSNIDGFSVLGKGGFSDHLPLVVELAI